LTVVDQHDHLFASVCRGEVGAVFVAEAIGLARVSRRWSILVEFSGLVDTLIADANTICDPRTSEDRVLLGMNGTLNEMDVLLYRHCARKALRQPNPRPSGLIPVAYPGGLDRERPDTDSDDRLLELLHLYLGCHCGNRK
jgi:hypothetical protein